jgi:hypothetical protein
MALAEGRLTGPRAIPTDVAVESRFILANLKKFVDIMEDSSGFTAGTGVFNPVSVSANATNES